MWLYRLIHLQFRDDITSSELDECLARLKRTSQADEVAWCIVGELAGAGEPGWNPTVGVLLAFPDGDAGWERWCLNGPLHFDSSDFVMARCEAKVSLLTGVEADERRRIERLGVEAYKSLDRGGAIPNVGPMS